MLRLENISTQTCGLGLLLLSSLCKASYNGRGDFPQYSLHQHVSFDPKNEILSVSAETEAMTFFDDSDYNMEINPTGSSSSTAFVSMEYGFYQGPSVPSPNVKDMDLFDSDFDIDSDDDDDDDDDGHSMMLSNTSIRRSLALACGSDNNEPSSKSNSNNRHSRQSKQKNAVTSIYNLSSTRNLSSRSQSKPMSSTLKSLSVRGGGGLSSLLPQNEFSKRLLVAALVTLLYEGALGHFLEFVKIVMQTSPAGTTYLDVFRTITSEKGIVGIWDGFVPWGVIQSIAKGGVFGLARAVALSVLMPLADEGKIPNILALTLAGGIAGGFQGYVLSPTLLLKTRVMTSPIFREQMSLLRTTVLSLRIGMDVVAKEGIGALMKGSNVFALKRVFDWATRFYFSDVFSTIIKKYIISSDTLTAGQKITADLLGGTASTLVTLPLDVLVAKSQDAKKAGVRVSALAMFKEELEEKGWGGLYDSYMRGFEARLLHVCFTTVAMRTGTGLMYDALFKN